MSADEKTSIQARCRCEPITGIVPFMNLVTQAMTTELYASARRDFWNVDNGSSRRGTKATRARPFSRSSSAKSSRERLHGPQRGSGSAPGIRRPPQRRGTAFPSEVHHLRPG